MAREPWREGGSGTLQFAPGETDKAVLIDVIGDLADETDETFTATLSSPQNANLGNATETVTIVDNDPVPTGVPIFDALDAQVREGASGTTDLSFTVTRRDDTAGPVTVHYAVSNGTALSPSDYTVVSATGTLSFAASETNMTVDVVVLGDRVLEHDETLYLSLTNPSSGAAIEDGQGSGTIVNDDTKTTAVVKVRAAKHAVAVRGLVMPSRPGKQAIVRLYRRSSGRWVRIATRRPLLRGKTDTNGDGFTDSHYRSTLTRAKRGRCRIVATYPGDAKFARSLTVKRFRC
jgi:Calx-beta domain